MIGAPFTPQTSRLVRQCYIARATFIDMGIGLGLYTRRHNFRGAIVSFATDAAWMPHAFGTDVVFKDNGSHGAFAPFENILVAGVIDSDLYADGFFVGRWVDVLQFGETDRILMATGGAETDVVTIWARQSVDWGGGSHKELENRARRHLAGKVVIDSSLGAPGATLNLSGANDTGTVWNAVLKPAFDPTDETSIDAPGGCPTALSRFVAFSPEGPQYSPTDLPPGAAGARRGFVNLGYTGLGR